MALTDNLLAYWKLDGNSNDSISSNNGSDTNITYSAGNGKINQGAGFNGTNSEIICNDPIGAISAFSLALWFNASAIDGTNWTVISSGNTSDEDWSLGWSSSRPYFLLQDSNSTSHWVISNTAPSTGSWYHIGLSWSSGNIMKVYLNGSLENNFNSSNPTWTGTLKNSFSTSALRIGRLRTGYYKGALDEIGIWNRELSSTEFASLYNSGNGNQYPFSTPGPANLKSLNTNLKANIKSYNTNLIANVKSINTNV